ncbi:hypothetical protein [Anatilimnocola floriformis]|uniref:hypothetical protein n=1 Tax=Anatilimnocola floriformis TaxID=2948575 RepID=UPI0020C321BC|nr:hypothetical protein [Anatilimnocola floriformis]
MANDLLISAQFWTAIAIVLAITTSPVWLPALMIVYQGISAQRFGQFSMQFVMALVAAESLALGINVAIYRWTWLAQFLHSLRP